MELKEERRKPLGIKDLGIAGRAGSNVSPYVPTTYVICREKPARCRKNEQKNTGQATPTTLCYTIQKVLVVQHDVQRNHYWQGSNGPCYY